MSEFDRAHSLRSASDTDSLMRAFVQQPVDAMPPLQVRFLRERTVHDLERYRARLLGARAVRVKWIRTLLMAAAACAAVAVWVHGLGPHGLAAHRAAVVEVVPVVGTASANIGGVDRVLATSTQALLDSGDELRTGPDALARASLPTGTVVDIGSSADVRFDPGGGPGQTSLRDRIELAMGKVHVRVPKLKGGDEVSVLAAGVAVVVHGTEFSVERLISAKPGEPGVTRIAVTEGEVVVYTSTEKRVLAAGAVLIVMVPSEPIDRAAHPSAPSPPNTQPMSSGPSAPQPSLGVGSSTLATENELLAEAMRLRREHESQRALTRLRELLDRHPHSPLAETARVERLRALDDMGATNDLRREAERYLADYPNGYARPEASQMLASSSKNKP
jgi:hypothetical protein